MTLNLWKNHPHVWHNAKRCAYEDSLFTVFKLLFKIILNSNLTRNGGLNMWTFHPKSKKLPVRQMHLIKMQLNNTNSCKKSSISLLFTSRQSYLQSLGLLSPGRAKGRALSSKSKWTKLILTLLPNGAWINHMQLRLGMQRSGQFGDSRTPQ